MQETLPQPIINDTTDFTHGTIVAIKSHHFEHEIFSPVLAGNPLTVSPLMIVIEQLVESRTSYNERTGEEITKSGSSQCKCIWFSSKKQEFIDAWFPSKFLKVIEKIDSERENQLRPSRTENLNKYTSKLVRFRTCNLETKKRKSSVSIKSNELDESSTIAPLLNFVSPVMQIVQVMEFKNVDTKEAIYDSKTGIKKRRISDWVAKCRWYNSELEKTSEKLIPLDCLEEIIPVDTTYLMILQSAITAGHYLSNDKILIKPHKIIYMNGEYILRGYSYISNKVIERDIKKLNNLTAIKKYFTDRAKMFNPETGEILDIIDAIKKANLTNNYIRIKYSKDDNELSTRTISKFKLINANNSEGVLTDYLIGFDHLRKAKRTFVVAKIKSIKILDLQFDTTDYGGVLEQSIAIL